MFTHFDNFNRNIFCILLIYQCLICTSDAEKYKLCVVDGKGLFKTSTRYCPILENSPDSKVECEVGVDRLDCLRRISKGKADFAVLTPEDLVTAANSEIEVLLTNELRYTDEKNEYEVVAVFRNSSGIKSLHDLKDKNFCHPGYGYESEWTRILSNFLEASVIPQSCQTQFTITENRIKASSEFFKSACKAGPWVNNPDLDQQLKLKYPNLCKLCGDPYQCAITDKYWGRRGSLYCLTDGGGDISWARLDDVRYHFGLLPGNSDSTLTDYSFLCHDGTIRPINSSNPCVWVVKPWPVIASKRTIAQEIQQLMSNIAKSRSSKWESSVLSLVESYHLSVKNLNPIEPIESYLARATGFLSANSFTGCHPPRTIKICTTSNVENAKCSWMRESAAVYGIEPDLDCLKADNTTHCMQAVENNNADIIMVPPESLHTAIKKYSLKTLFYETVNNDDKYITVAVTRNNNVVKNLEELRGYKACFPNYDGIAWNTVHQVLKERDLLESCSDVDSLTNFFAPSCIPGIPNKKSSCHEKVYSGDFGALRCLLDGKGDVAFLSENSIRHFISSAVENKFIKTDTSTFRVMCDTKLDGCYMSWATVGYGMVRANSTKLWLKDTLDVFLRLDSLFGKNYKSLTTPLQLFGSFNDQTNVLFHDKTVRLREVPYAKNLEQMPRTYEEVLYSEIKCQVSSAAISFSAYCVLLSCIFSILL